MGSIKSLQSILKFFDRLAFGLTFLVPFSCLYVSSETVYPYILGKSFLFRTLISTALILFFIQSLVSPLQLRYDFKKIFFSPHRSIQYLFFTFMFWIFFVSFWSPDPVLSFFSNFARMEGILGFLYLIGYLFLLKKYINSKNVKYFVWSWALVALVQFGLGVLQNLRFWPSVDPLRLDGTLGNSAYYGFSGSLFFFWSGLCFLISKNNLQKKLSFALSFISILIVFWSQSRAALGAVIFGLAFFFLFYSPSYLLLLVKKFKWTFTAVLFSLLLLILVIARPDQNLFGRLAQVLNLDASLQARWAIWSMSFRAFLERPVWGWGLESMQFLSGFYKPENWMNPWFDRAHNILIEWTVSGGLIALILFSVIMILILKNQFKNKFLFGFGFIWAYLFNNLFVFDYLLAQLMLLGFIVFSQQIHNKESLSFEEDFKFENTNDSHQMIHLGIKLFSLASVLVLSFSMYYFIFSPYQKSKALRSIVTPRSQVSFEVINSELDELKQMIILSDTTWQGFGRYEVYQLTFDKLNQLALQKANWNNETSRKIKDFYEWFTDHVEYVIKKQPDFIHFRISLGSLYVQYLDYKRAEKIYLELISKYPDHQFVWVDYGSFYLSQGQIDLALKIYEKALAYDYNFNLGRQFRALALIFKGSVSEYKAEIEWLRKNAFGLHFDSRILTALAQTKQSDLLQKLVKEKEEYYNQLKQPKSILQEIF